MENFKGNIHTTLGNIFERFPEISAMEVLYSISHKSNFKGKHYTEVSEEDFYSSAERFLKHNDTYFDDEPLADDEFEIWITSKFQN